MEIKSITEKEFSFTVEKATKPVLVQFFASWCGPCNSLTSELESLTAEGCDVDIVKVNVDENNHLAERFAVKKLPCMILFKNGEAVKTVEGFRTKKQIKKMIEENA